MYLPRTLLPISFVSLILSQVCCNCRYTGCFPKYRMCSFLLNSLSVHSVWRAMAHLMWKVLKTRVLIQLLRPSVWNPLQKCCLHWSTLWQEYEMMAEKGRLWQKISWNSKFLKVSKILGIKIFLISSQTLKESENQGKFMWGNSEGSDMIPRIVPLRGGGFYLPKLALASGRCREPHGALWKWVLLFLYFWRLGEAWEGFHRAPHSTQRPVLDLS